MQSSAPHWRIVRRIKRHKIELGDVRQLALKTDMSDFIKVQQRVATIEKLLIGDINRWMLVQSLRLQFERILSAQIIYVGAGQIFSAGDLDADVPGVVNADAIVHAFVDDVWVILLIFGNDLPFAFWRISVDYEQFAAIEDCLRRNIIEKPLEELSAFIQTGDS